MPASRLSTDERSDRSTLSRLADEGEVAHELARLETLDLTQLRVQFRNRTGRVAPARISRPLLLRLIGYRLQAERFSDLAPDTKRFLDRLASAAAASSADAARPNDRASVAAAEGRMRPRTGTVLVREWQGRLEQVRVFPDGFGWNGATYASLSAAAFAITGTRWNGHRFFGLGRHGKADQAGKAARVVGAAQTRFAASGEAAAAAKATSPSETASLAGPAPARKIGRNGDVSPPRRAAQVGKVVAPVRTCSRTSSAPLRRTSQGGEAEPRTTVDHSSAAGLTGTAAQVGRAVPDQLAPVGTAAALISPARASAGAIA